MAGCESGCCGSEDKGSGGVGGDNKVSPDEHKAHGDCCHDDHCHSDNNNNKNNNDIEEEDEDENGVTCLAVVKETGTEISLFDANGEVRSFAFKGDIRKLCFSSHGRDADDLLTPCFDEDGLHGTPDEGCFCGLDEPHLHAHMHDPKTCNDDNEDDDHHHHHQQQKTGDLETELMNLARLTLLPVAASIDTRCQQKDSTKNAPLLQIPESEFMPTQCNSREYARHLSGTDLDEPPLESPRMRRMHKVQHHDHIDYLVHNKITGDLHLEHPCDSCGQNDYHGKFHLVGKRKWDTGNNAKQLHIFETSQNHFSLFHLFEPESDRVAVIRPEGLHIPHNQNQKQSTGCCNKGAGSCCSKSKVATDKSCCKSETGTPSSCCKPKTCGADGDGGCSAKAKSPAESKCCESKSKDCCASKSCGGDDDDDAKATKACCAKEASCCDSDSCCVGESCCANESCCAGKSCCAGESCCKNATESPDVTFCADNVGRKKYEGDKKIIVRSSLTCSQICCSSEIPAIEKVLKSRSGIVSLMVNPTLRRVTIDHDITIITASDIENILNENRFGATVQHDGGESQARKGKGKSRFYVEKICCASEIPAIRNIVEPLDGVSNVSINVTTKTVYVEHDCTIIGATDICNALNEEAFGASIEHDAGKDNQASSAFVTSILSFDPEACDPLIKEKLTDFLKTFQPPQIQTFVVDVPRAKITVVHNPLLVSAHDVATALAEKMRLEVKVDVDGKESMVWDFPDLPADENETVRREKATLKPTVILSGVFWVVSMLSFIGGNWEYLKYVALLSVAFGLPAIAVKAFRTLRRLQFDANCLMFFAAAGAVALQEFTEAAAVTFLFALSEWLEVRATTRARNALSAIVQLRPESGNLVHPQSGEIVVVPVSAIPVGALVSVRPGDKVPCDGVVIEGCSTVDESSLTGESRPVRKAPNDAVSGGTINCGNSHLMVRTTASADDSAVARLIRLVEEAQANRSETEKLVDEFARVYTPVIVFAALVMCTIPWAWGSEIGAQWTHNGLVLIVVACPCALIISTPVSYVAGLAATAQKGILIKGGAHLEALALVKSICFDKTGTLTQGKFQMLHLNVIGESKTRQEVLEYLALVEERASHPLAQALVDAARRENVEPPKHLYVKDHTVLAGEGVSGVVNEAKVYVGNRRLFERLGYYESLSASEKAEAQAWEEAGGTVGFMSIEDHGIVCSYCVADAVRPEAFEVLKKFDCMGISVTMLTGDNADAAKSIGKQVGLEGDSIKSQLLPEDKLALVSEMKNESQGSSSVIANLFSKQRLVLMCGDGVNDAPALAAADVGVAMGEGAALAMETADVTLLDSSLEKLVYSVNMGRRVTRKIKENVLFSVSVKFVVLGFALAGKASLWGAIASDVGAMILVTLNGMLLLPAKTKTEPKQPTVGDDDVEKGNASIHDSPGGDSTCAARRRNETAQMNNDGSIKNCCASGGGCCGSTEE